MSKKQQKQQPKVKANNIIDIVNCSALDINKSSSHKGFMSYTEIIYVAETAERYEDMCALCKKLVLIKSQREENLDIEQRNLLSVAYKRCRSKTIYAWNALKNIVDSEITSQYKHIIEHELEDICMEMLDLLLKHIYKHVEGHNDESEVYYLKMIGDYSRHLAALDITKNEGYDTLSEEYYMKAMNIADQHLEGNHPTRLGLALNFGVCCYEILKQPQRAIDISKKAFAIAINFLDNLASECSYKDETLILQLLRDNTVEWLKEQNTERSVKLIDGYIRNIKTMYNLVIPTEINPMFFDYYFFFDDNTGTIMGL